MGIEPTLLMSQISALPLNYIRLIVGIEPEPLSFARKTNILPLNYHPIGRKGIRTPD